MKLTSSELINTNSKSHKLKIIILIIIIAFVLVVVATVIGVVFTIKKKPIDKPVVCRYGIDNSNKCIECGLKFSQNKIIGGQNAVAHSWPSIALVIFSYTFESQGYLYKIETSCGGNLINRDTILTAGHCILKTITLSDGSSLQVKPNSYYPTYESMYKVYLGVHNKSDNIVKSTGIKFYKIHPDYDDDNALNDIAILKLSNKVELNDNIQVACLPDSFSYPKKIDIEGYIVGWGRTNETDENSPDILQEGVIKVYDKSKCSLVTPEAIKNWGNQICAGRYEGGVDTCQGDSGGPLFVKDYVDGKQKYVLAGITSYGDGCGQAGKPGIYTRVSSYLDWIESFN